MLLLVWLAFYAPVVNYAERHWIMPVRTRGNVVIVHRMAPAHNVERGEWIMYLQNEDQNELIHNRAVYVRAGFGWGPVLAVAGDLVAFSTNSFSVNGVEHPLLPHMPAGGEWTVPEKNWFVWPELDINGRGDVGEAAISGMMMRLATVSESEFIGKPFKHWFFRRQISP